jgi:NAD(P)-dependent dehydrogenase (short-subunit alcohol dehydrogenase family)
VNEKVAFITGASRGIGAESAVALAKAGYTVAITARTLNDGEAHDHVGTSALLPGSLEATRLAVEKVGGTALCLQADILEPESVVIAAHETLKQFGRVDLLFNNAVYQGTGNMETLMDVTPAQLLRIYQGNVFTPLELIKILLPNMLSRGSGTVLNMVSHSAFTNPPAAAADGGWGFAYPSSKAALSRMAGSLRAEHPDAGLRVYNIEPGLVMTEVMRLAGIDDAVMERFRPCTPATIAAVVAWLAENEPAQEWQPEELLRAPAIAKELNLLKVPSLLGS